MKKAFFGLLFTIIISFQAYGSDLAQVKLLGDVDDDFARAIAKTADGGYVLAGNSRGIEELPNNGQEDFYVAKFDKQGNLEWQKMYGGSLADNAYDIKATTDGGFIIAGRSASDDIDGAINHGEEDCYVIKLDGAGNKLWQVMFGGSRYDGACAVQEAADGGYLVVGYSFSRDIPGTMASGDNDIYVIKLDRDGKIEWQKLYGGSKDDIAISVAGAKDGGLVIAAMSNSEDIKGIKNKGFFDYYLFNSTMLNCR